MTVLDHAVTACLALLVLAVLLAFVRLVLGPTLTDRVVALDIVGVASVAFVVVIAVMTGESTLLRVATVQALIAFMGIVAFAFYIQRKNR